MNKAVRFKNQQNNVSDTHNEKNPKDAMENKISEQEIIKCSKQLSLISNDAITGIIAIRDDIIIHCNNMASSFFNLSSDAMLLADLIEIINETVHPDDKEAFIKHLEEIQNESDNNKAQKSIFRVINNKGQFKWFELHTQKMDNDNPDFLLTIIDITNYKLVEQRYQSKANEMKIMLKVSQALSSSLNINEVMQTASDSLTEIIGIGSAAVYLLYGEKLFLGATTPPLSPDMPDELRWTDLEGHLHIQKALNTKEPVVLEDTQNAALTKEEAQIVELRNLRSILYVPIVLEEKSIGILIMSSSDEVRIFSEKDIDLCKTLVNQLAVSINNANLHNDLVKKNKELKYQISEREQAEKKLIMHQYHLSKAQEIGKIGTWELNIRDNSVIWTDETYKIFSVPTGKQMDFNLQMNKVHPEDLEYVNQQWQRALKQTTFDIEYRIIVDKQVKWIKQKAEIKSDKDGNPIRAIGFAQDISERKQIEMELISKNKFLDEIFESLTHPFFVINANDYTISIANKASQNERFRKGITCFELSHGRKSPCIGEDYVCPLEIVKKTKKSCSMEHTHYNANGEEEIVEVHLYPIIDKNGNVEQIIESSINITLRKKAEEDLKILNENLEEKIIERTAKLDDAMDELKYEIEERIRVEESLREVNITKDKFFSIIAHDLRNPMQVLLTSSYLLDNYYKKQEFNKLDNHIDKIIRSINGLNDLLEHLLTWARSQSGKISFKPVKMGLNEVFNKHFDLLKLNADKKNIELSIHIPDDAIIFADRDMITNVLLNLTQNALKFTHAGGKINISAKKFNNYYKISVADTGIGIAEEDLDNLFRIDVSRSTPGTAKERGTGLGLIICNEFIEKHNSKLKAKSTVGIGSTFYFSLPVID